MPKKTFAIGDVLTATDVNAYLMNQSVMVFATSAARATAIPSPIEGMITYLENTDVTEYYTGSAWAALATTASVATKANIASPTFTGTVVAPTLNATTYQQSGNTGAIVRSAAVAVPFTTSNSLHLVNMPSGCNVYNLINVHPTTGVNNTVTLTETRYGDWSGVQNTTQIGLVGYLGNGVHLETFSVTFYWLA